MPVAFLSRYLTKTEMKWSSLEQTVSLVSWALRQTRRYTTYAQKIRVIVECEEEVAVILDRNQHIRLRALLVELSLYKVEWVCEYNRWAFGEGLIEAVSDPGGCTVSTLPTPVMKHKEVQLKRPGAVSHPGEGKQEPGHVLI
jgi:hypothetical protein